MTGRRRRTTETPRGGRRKAPGDVGRSPTREARPACPAVLGTEQSAALRERLLASLGQLQSADEAADWVHANLAAKNTLIAADADRVNRISATDWQRLRRLPLARKTRNQRRRAGI